LASRGRRAHGRCRLHERGGWSSFGETRHRPCIMARDACGLCAVKAEGGAMTFR